MNNDNNNTTNLELGNAPEEKPGAWALPPKAEILAANPEVRAILYAETLERIAAAGEEVDAAWVQGAIGGDEPARGPWDLHIKHTPRLLKEAPEFAAEVKAGRKKLPTKGNAWHFFWQKKATEAAKASTANPTPNSDANSGKTSPIGEEKLELATFEPEPEPAEKERCRQRFEELKSRPRPGRDPRRKVLPDGRFRGVR
jgi:hypothetical protein